MHSPSVTSGDVGGDLPNDAQRLKATAAERIHSEVDTRKSPVVDQVRSLSSALDNAAQQLSDSSQTPAWLHSLFEQGAQQMRRLADSVEQRDSRQLLNDVRAVARSSPGTYLAACAAAGFAASRILRADPKEPDVTAQFGGHPAPPLNAGINVDQQLASDLGGPV